MNKIQEQTIGTAELSKLTGMTKRTLRRHYELNHMPHPQAGRYPFDETIKALLAHQAARVEAGGGTHLAEKTKLVTARRQKVEVELQTLKGQFLAKSEVAPILRNLATNQRRALMGALTTDFANQLKELDPITLRLLMQNKVDEVCDFMQANARKHCDTPTADAGKVQP